MRIQDCYLLGTITKKHGIKGEVVIKLDTDQPEMYNNLESILLYIKGDLVPFFIKNRKWNSRGSLIVIFENEDFNSVEKLIGIEIYLPLSTLPKRTGNSFYYHEIIGFSILRTENQKNIGIIVSVNDETPQILLILEDEYQKQVIIPLVDDWIVNVNREQKFIEMELPLGIEEL